jgi:putative FmdB family regulatory protein
MATYTYKCSPCEHEFEVEHPVTAAKGSECPKCGARTEERLIAGSNFVLVGDGWAKDLYHKG